MRLHPKILNLKASPESSPSLSVLQKCSTPDKKLYSARKESKGLNMAALID